MFSASSPVWHKLWGFTPPHCWQAEPDPVSLHRREYKELVFSGRANLRHNPPFLNHQCRKQAHKSHFGSGKFQMLPSRHAWIPTTGACDFFFGFFLKSRATVTNSALTCCGELSRLDSAVSEGNRLNTKLFDKLCGGEAWTEPLHRIILYLFPHINDDGCQCWLLPGEVWRQNKE